MRKSVILYEDEPELRSLLENIFNEMNDEFQLLHSFPHADDVLAHLTLYQPDIILMDIQMNSYDDGIYALYKIKNKSRSTKVMMLTTFDHDDKVFNSIALGADGYMLKSDFSSYKLPQELIRNSLRTIMDGGAYLTPSVAKQILNLFTNNRIPDLIRHVKDRFNALFKNEASANNLKIRLTRMQKVVLQALADGKTTFEIANELHLSPNTINTHIKAIYSLLEVHSRARAIKKAIEYNLVRLS